MTHESGDAAGRRETMLQRARDLVPALRQRAAETERLRRIPDDTIGDLHDTGLLRILQPARIGGGEFDYGLMVEVSAELGRGCGSTAWVFANLSAHHWMLAMWPPQAQDALWDADRDVLIASSLVYPAGHAEPVEGGFRLSGRWPFSSGIDGCAWVMLGANVEMEGGAPEPRIFLVPKSQLRVLDTWHVTGLEGTGSQDLEGEDILVAAHMALAAADIRGGDTPGAAVNPGPLFKLPVLGLFPHLVCGPALGMAQGAYDHYVAATGSRLSAYNRSKLSVHVTTHLKIAEAGAAIQAARLLLRENCDEAAGVAATGAAPSVALKVRWRRDGAFAAMHCVRAVDLLYAASGGGAIYRSNPLQRFFRDVHAAAAHIGLSWDVNGADFGRLELGLGLGNPNI